MEEVTSLVDFDPFPVSSRLSTSEVGKGTAPVGRVSWRRTVGGPVVEVSRPPPFRASGHLVRGVLSGDSELMTLVALTFPCAYLSNYTPATEPKDVTFDETFGPILISTNNYYFNSLHLTVMGPETSDYLTV